MLRETLGRRASDNADPTPLFFMNGTTTETIEPPSPEVLQHHTNDLNDDIFGSAPSSPVLSATAINPPRQTEDQRRTGRTDHSDIPRLRSIHVTNGYREGIAVSKESHVQAGFDEGFSLGGEIGQKVGWILGVLEGVVRGVRRKKRREQQQRNEERNEGEAEDEAEVAFTAAQAELRIEVLLGKDWFGEDGIWKYEVPGEEKEDVTFEVVAEAHPVVRKWRERTMELSQKVGLRMEEVLEESEV